jgi:hypothetical protein
MPRMDGIMSNQLSPSGYYFAPLPPRALPTPPRLHWGWLLVLNVLTRGLFSAVWLLVQANWVRKVRGRSTAFTWAIIHLCFFPFIFVGGIFLGALFGFLGRDYSLTSPLVESYQVFVVIGILVLYYGTTFILRSELEAEPIGMSLGGGMTFFFGTIYFQYHLRDFEFADGTPKGSGMLNLSQPAMPPIAGSPQGF